MKPITYYVQNEQLDRLTDRFGQELDQLDRAQKLQIRVTLSYYILGRDCMGDNYSINDAWMEALQPIMCEDALVVECLEILQGITVQDAESLLEALSAQLRQGNARLKTAVETTASDLVSHNVPHELAKTAAYIIHKVDSQRPRTTSEQETINQVHRILTGVK